eukprot:scaffold536954_cov43-Prasinocladus_malaysianus.AAC.1
MSSYLHSATFSASGQLGRYVAVLPPIDSTGHGVNNNNLAVQGGPALLNGSSTQAGRYDSKQAHLQRQVKQLAAQNGTLKQALKRQAQAAEDEIRSLRDQLSHLAPRQTPSGPNTRDACTQIEFRVEEDDATSRLRDTVTRLQAETSRQKEQLEVSLLLRKQMENEHLISLEKMVAHHNREKERMRREHDMHVAALTEQLEDVVLRAAIDLNRQYRDLQIKHKMEARKRVPNRRRTDGGHPWMDEEAQAALQEYSGESSSSFVPRPPPKGCGRRFETEAVEIPKEPCTILPPPSVRSAKANASIDSPGISAWSPDAIRSSKDEVVSKVNTDAWSLADSQHVNENIRY